MPVSKRIVGILAWVIIIGGIFPASRAGDLLAQQADGPLFIVLFLGLIVAYLAVVGVSILLMDIAVRRLSERFGWDYEKGGD